MTISETISFIRAYGTSEGVKKAWESRPRGMLQEKVGQQNGTNPGGLYKGEDGITRYVKFYKDAASAHGELVANAIYRDLSLAAPKSSIGVDEQGRQFVANELMPGKELNSVQITPELAQKIMQGFAADVLTANWDAIGLEHDNVLVHSGEPARIDQGGSFLMRAMASSGRKPESLLNNPTELQGFFNHGINHAYASVANKAGYQKAEDVSGLKKQVSDIVALRDKSGGWDKYVTDKDPDLKGSDRTKIVQMLDARTNALKSFASKL